MTLIILQADNIFVKLRRYVEAFFNLILMKILINLTALVNLFQQAIKIPLSFEILLSEFLKIIIIFL